MLGKSFAVLKIVLRQRKNEKNVFVANSVKNSTTNVTMFQSNCTDGALPTLPSARAIRLVHGTAVVLSTHFDSFKDS